MYVRTMYECVDVACVSTYRYSPAYCDVLMDGWMDSSVQKYEVHVYVHMHTQSSLNRTQSVPLTYC